jgi:hypothetical protein
MTDTTRRRLHGAAYARLRRLERIAADGGVNHPERVNAEVVHFEETGFRVAANLTWVLAASSGKWVLVPVRPKAREGRDGDAGSWIPVAA